MQYLEDLPPFPNPFPNMFFPLGDVERDKKGKVVPVLN
jgi:hypothetical protein